ncbi:MAG: hypothetical protein QGI21_06160 [Candidatus Poseidoniaceae archaeon]|jgi:hypothetical protein|nr:hypothetical protein [Candidatus Poseidoniaceae archaeon]
MEFSIIGAEDSLDEAKLRLEKADVLIVLGSDSILGVLTTEHLSRKGNCGNVCELDVLVDRDLKLINKWRPAFTIVTEDGEPISVNHGP